MTGPRSSRDALLTAALIEQILFLEDCEQREAVAPHELGVEADLLREQLRRFEGGNRASLLQVLAAMYHDASRRSNSTRARDLAGLYHELAATRLPGDAP